MESPWLVRDPRPRARSKEAKAANLSEDRKPADATPVRDEEGRPVLPAKSLRGALRSRAEMILRTLGLPCAAHPGDIPAVSTKDKTRSAAFDEISKADLAARLFGLSGWRAPLHVGRFVPEKDTEILHQEFVAIDRFTGGAADSAKFDADLAAPTTLEGALELDLDRLEKVDPDFASLGLLALVLRDLAEGDIPLGSGSSKGQGFCTAEASVLHNGESFPSLAEWFASEPVQNALAAFRNLGHQNQTTTQP
jgi:CRISPR/Cas system CSM-associated protein Csm3 (group 7 of RAMP superfamily)